MNATRRQPLPVQIRPDDPRMLAFEALLQAIDGRDYAAAREATRTLRRLRFSVVQLTDRPEGAAP